MNDQGNTNPVSGLDAHDDFLQLLIQYFDQTLAESEMKRLNSLLRSNAEYRRQLIRYSSCAWAIHEIGPLHEQESISVDTTNSGVTNQESWSTVHRFRLPAVAALIGLLVLVTSFLIFQTKPDDPERQPNTNARSLLLHQVTGDIRLIRADSSIEKALSGTKVAVGDTVTIGNDKSGAALVYQDGTRVVMVGNTTVTTGGKTGKQLVIHRGLIGAIVKPQPADKPLVFVTPKAKLRVRGTRFTVHADGGQTDLSVREGKVQLTRISDGHSIDVPGGKRAVTGSELNKLTLLALDTAPSEWSMDFENGLPSNWRCGIPVKGNKEAGFNGGVRADRKVQKDGVFFSICTPKLWKKGLFTSNADTHLHFRYKLNKPDWFQLFLSTRSFESNRPVVATYRFKIDKLWWPLRAGQWRTATIPLSAFGRVSDLSETPFSPDELPFELLFSSKDNDLSLVIDRIWITTGGPGRFDVKMENDQ